MSAKVKVKCNTSFVAVWDKSRYGGMEGAILEVPKGLAKDLIKAGHVSPVKGKTAKSSPAKVQSSAKE